VAYDNSFVLSLFCYHWLSFHSYESSLHRVFIWHLLSVCVFSLDCVYLRSYLPCTFVWWVPILDFDLWGFSSLYSRSQCWNRKKKFKLLQVLINAELYGLVLAPRLGKGCHQIWEANLQPKSAQSWPWVFWTLTPSVKRALNAIQTTNSLITFFFLLLHLGTKPVMWCYIITTKVPVLLKLICQKSTPQKNSRLPF